MLGFGLTLSPSKAGKGNQTLKKQPKRYNKDTIKYQIFTTNKQLDCGTILTDLGASQLELRK